MENFDEKLDMFLTGAQAIIDTYYGKREWKTPHLEVMRGPRYLRIVSVDDGCRKTAWGFIDRTTGDVLKAETWRKPAKHARGNIFDEHNGLSQIEWHGPKYLR